MEGPNPMSDMSPAVERAVEAARRRAGGGDLLPLAHLALELLADDEGRPAVFLEARGVSLDAVRAGLEALPPAAAPPPHVRTLFAAAREWSLAHRADPVFTSDVFLLAVLRSAPAFGASAADLGLWADDLERSLAGPAETPAAMTHASHDEPVAAAVGGDHFAAARVIDANLNRARESLRVLDDYCRFVLDDALLTGQFKALRHDLAALTATLPAGLLLAARDTTGDVGTSLVGAAEYARSSPREVAAVNLKRLEESLRSVEEFGKLLTPEFAAGVERLRYRAYTLERAVVRGADARDRLAGATLYVLVSAAECAASLERTIEQAAAGGADVVQLREKSLTDRVLIERARDVRGWTERAGVLFVVNDRPDVARLVGADGVHLGQDDMPVADARRVVGPDTLIGVSTHSVDQVRQAVLDGADYLGVGPTFPSRTKSFDHFPGLRFIRDAAAETTLPAFALGGIGLETVAAAVSAGARRVAVGAAIARATDPRAAARALTDALSAGGSVTTGPAV